MSRDDVGFDCKRTIRLVFSQVLRRRINDEPNLWTPSSARVLGELTLAVIASNGLIDTQPPKIKQTSITSSMSSEKL